MVHYGSAPVKHYGAPLFLGLRAMLCSVNVQAHDPVGVLVDNVRALMRHTETSKAQLAQRSGISERMIAYILAKERTPTVETADSLARAFGLTGWQLMIPNLSLELAKEGKLEQLVKNYSTSSRKGREYIDRVAEQEAKYGRDK